MMLLHHIAVISLPPGTGNCLSPAVAPNCYGLGEYSLGTPVRASATTLTLRPTPRRSRAVMFPCGLARRSPTPSARN